MRVLLIASLALFLSHCGPKLAFYPGQVIRPESTLEWSGFGCHADYNQERDGIPSLKLMSSGKCRSTQIPVIPGHYEMSVEMLSSGVQWQRELHKQLEIRLIQYDVRGRELEATEVVRGREQKAGNLSSALYRVTELPENSWTKLYLRPNYYPHDSGWLLPETRKVAFEITFSGEGTLWFNALRVQYSKWNVSLKERLRQADSHVSDYVLYPKPREVTAHPIVETSRVCIDLSDRLEILRQYSKPLQRLYERLSEQKFEYFDHSNCETGFEIKILPLKSIRAPYPKRYTRLAKKPEGYAIIRERSDSYILTASTFRGIEYGLGTLTQFFSSGQVFPREVVDYPYFRVRAASAKNYGFQDFADGYGASRTLSANRFNQLWIELNATHGNWWEIDTDASALIASMSKIPTFLDSGVLLNPYIHLADTDFEDYTFKLSSKEERRKVAKLFAHYSSLGAKNLVLRLDDYVPTDKEIARFAYSLSEAEDKSAYRSLAVAHLDLIKTIQSHLPKESTLYITPPWYANFFIDQGAGTGERYFRDLAAGLPKGTRFLWTGESVRSLRVNELQAMRYQALLPGMELMLWDNTPYARRHRDMWGVKAGRVELNSYIEPFDIEIPLEMHKEGVYLNAASAPLHGIQIATAGAYLWNPEGYKPEESLLSYLYNEYGKDAAWLLIEVDHQIWRKRAGLKGMSYAETLDLVDQFAKAAPRAKSALLLDLRNKMRKAWYER